MKSVHLTRRGLLNSAAAAGALGLAGFADAKPGEARSGRGKAKPPAPEVMAAIDTALGKKGTLNEAQGVYTVSLPRNDLKMRIKDEPVPIPFGFGGWVSFKETRDGKAFVMMSDCVLLQEEVNPLISAAHENGIEVTAIHNHFFYEEPRMFFMHVHGMGEPGDLAHRYSMAIRNTKLHPANQPPAGPPPARTGKDIFDVPALDRIAGYEAAVNGPTIKYTVGRSDLTVMAMGAEITAAIGLNSWAALTGSMDRAHIAGDIAMLEPEINPVIKALRASNLEVVALHHHMIGEDPRIIFLHYFGTGPALQLTRGFRSALDELGKHGKSMRMMGEHR